MDVNAEYLRLKAAIRSDPRTYVNSKRRTEAQEQYRNGLISSEDFQKECTAARDTFREIEASHSR